MGAEEKFHGLASYLVAFLYNFHHILTWSEVVEFELSARTRKSLLHRYAETGQQLDQDGRHFFQVPVKQNASTDGE